MNEETQQSPTMTPEQTKKVPPRGTPERRQYDKTAKQRSREKARQKQLRSQVPTASEYELPKPQRDELTENFHRVVETISWELEELSTGDEYIIQMMCDVLVSDARNWTRKVSSPNGILYGSVFPDAAASDVIWHVHIFPILLESETFANLYQDFLKLAHKLSRNDWFSPECARDVQAELDGTYCLPPDPQMPKPAEPAPAPDPKLPTALEVLENGRAQLLEHLRGQIPPDAFRYLTGGAR